MCRIASKSFARFVQRPETLVGKRHAVDVAEEHRAAKFKLAARALEFLHRRGWIIQRQRRQRHEFSALRAHHLRERVVHQRRKFHGVCGRFHVRPGSRQRNHLHVDAVFCEFAFAKIDVAMPAHRDVVIAGIMQPRIALRVEINFHHARTRAQRIQIRRRIVMIVNINNRHSGFSSRPSVSNVRAPAQRHECTSPVGDKNNKRAKSISLCRLADFHPRVNRDDCGAFFRALGDGATVGFVRDFRS